MGSNALNPPRTAEARRISILAIGGTTRKNSTSERALQLAANEARKAGADVTVIAGPDLVLPMFDPGVATDDPRVAELLAAIRRCDGVLISSASYHGGLPGVLKNVIDYIDGLDAERPYLHGRAVGCVACAGGWQATGSTLLSLRSIVHALRGWPVPLGVAINTTQKVFSDNGDCLDADAAENLKNMARQVVEFSRLQGLAKAASQGADDLGTQSS